MFVYQPSLPHRHAISNAAFVVHSVGIDEAALGVRTALVEQSLEHRAVVKVHGSQSMRHAVLPLAMIDSTILVDDFGSSLDPFSPV